MNSIIFYIKDNIVYTKKNNHYIAMDVIKTFPTIALLETEQTVDELENAKELSFKELKERIYGE